MRIKKLHKDLILPTKGSKDAGAFDIYMPESGLILGLSTIKVGLGFSTEIPTGNVALILPRSSIGAKYGLELNNTCGVIDSDYRGEWIAVMRTKNNEFLSWEAGERLLQFILVPVTSVELELVDELTDTARGDGGFGSTGV